MDEKRGAFMAEYNLEKQHSKGKLHAIERIDMLLDDETFQEIELVKDRHYDGVIMGSGEISGKKVFLYVQDFTYKGGTLGRYHGRKISYLLDMAMKQKCPVIGVIDSGGARIQEGVKALAKYGDIFYRNTKASGFIPQISVIVGPCAGGAVYSPGITDFIFMVDKISNMFVTGPKVVKSVTNESVTAEDLGGTFVHSHLSGVAHNHFDNELDCMNEVRKLVHILPTHYGEKKKKVTKKDYIPKSQEKLIEIIPDKVNKAYDMKEVIDTIMDKESFIELQPEFARNVVIGFAKLSGITVGIVANQPNFMAGGLDFDAADKAARFIRYCDCYDIPIITLTDVPGFIPGVDQEKKGIIRHGAKMLYAYSEATTKKLNVILRKAYGGAYIAMSSKHLDADCVYAWPNAEIAVMGAEGAVEIIYAKDLKLLEGEAKDEFYQKKLAEYKESHMNTRVAVERGYVDEVIKPKDTRQMLFEALISQKKDKRRWTVPKKHGNIPL